MRIRIYPVPPAVILVCLLFSTRSFAQNVLPPNQPEQDACHALTICGGTFSTPYSYQGTGTKTDLSATPCGSGEANSMWIKVTIATAGSIVFSIIPKDPLDDYDFAVVNSTNSLCSSLSSTDVVRCNFNNNFPGSNVNGIVGLASGSSVDDVANGATGQSFLAPIDATAGQTYLIMINNFGHDDLSGPSSGFTIDFSGSTALFEKNALPAFGSIVKQCSDSSVTVELTMPVLCSSVAADGSDFSITPFVPVVSATGINCVSGNGYTSQVTIRFAGHVPGADYTLQARQGTDGNTLLNFCGDALPLPASLPFLVPPPVKDNFLPPDTVKCFYSTIPLVGESGFEQYLWNTGQTTPVIRVIDPGVYSLMVTDTNACIGVDSVSIADSACPQYVYLPTAFSPNGDGRNDLFRPLFAGAVSHFKFAVYDRWGRQVFESGNPSEGWNGTAGGRPQPAGVYVWMCIYELYKQPEKMQKGTVVLIR